MKTFKTKITAAALSAIISTSIAVQGKEEEIRCLPNNYAVVAADCFGNFLRSLKKINAIIYIPDSKIKKGTELSLIQSQAGARSLNMANYIRVQPVVKRGDECSSSVKVDFDNLNMIVFVEKSRLAELPSLNLDKVEDKIESLLPKLEQAGQTRVFPKIENKVSFKFDGMITQFSRVEYKH